MKGSLLLLALFIGIFVSTSVVQSAKRHRLHFPRHAALSVKEPFWGLDSDGNVYALNAAKYFVKVPGKTLIYVDVKVFYGEIHAFGIDKYLDVYQRVGEKGKWTYIKGRKLSFLRIQGPNRIWGVNTEDQIFTANVTTKEWKQIPGSLRYLDVHPTGRIWGVSRNYQIFTRGPEGGPLVRIPGDLGKIRVTTDGKVYGMSHLYNTLWWRDGINDEFKQIDGHFVNFDVNNRGELWGQEGVSEGVNLWYKPNVHGIWREIKQKVTKMRAQDSGICYCLNDITKRAYINYAGSDVLTEVYGAPLVSLFGPDGR